MKKMTVLAILGWSLVLVFGVVPGAQADVLTFDTVGSSDTPIPNGYGGLNWNNFYLANRTTPSYTGTGYDHGTVSGDFTAYNAWANPATVTGTPFDFVGAYLTGAWNDGLNIDVQGYLGGSLIYDSTVVVDSTAPPTFFTFDYNNIDTLRFSSSGGTLHNYDHTINGITYVGAGAHFAMDNFTFNEANAPVPEPTSLVLLGLGLSGMAFRRFRKA